MTDSRQERRLLDAACEIAREAGRAILDVYGRDDFAVSRKSDNSPLTEADQVAHGIISRALAKLDDNLPILSEESTPADHVERRKWQRYWLVDPLDGTKEFLKRNGEFTVNIALVDEHRALLGAVHAPVLDRMYFGHVTLGAWRSDAEAPPKPIAVRNAGSPLRVVGSRSHPTPELAAYLERLPPHDITDMGSSLKICLVAEGAADIYPRLGPTSEWDTAAAQAILESAGGRMIDLAGRPLRYNTKDSLLNPHFLAFGDDRRDWLAPIQTTCDRQDSN